VCVCERVHRPSKDPTDGCADFWPVSLGGEKRSSSGFGQSVNLSGEKRPSNVFLNETWH
jgi:hypothetical protein